MADDKRAEDEIATFFAHMDTMSLDDALAAASSIQASEETWVRMLTLKAAAMREEHEAFAEQKGLSPRTQSLIEALRSQAEQATRIRTKQERAKELGGE